MMTLPIQFVRFVIPVRKFMIPRESHHRNDQLPDSGYSKKGTCACDKPNRGAAECEVDNGANDRQSSSDRHNPAGCVSPGTLKDGSRAESSAVIPALEKCGCRWYCEEKHC